MFRQCGLKGRTAHAADGGDGTAEDKERTSTDKGVAHIAEEVEEDRCADDAKVEVVRARVLGLGASDYGAAEEAGDDGKDDEKGDDAAGVYDGDEDGSVEGVPTEREFAV